MIESSWKRPLGFHVASCTTLTQGRGTALVSEEVISAHDPEDLEKRGPNSIDFARRAALAVLWATLKEHNDESRIALNVRLDANCDAL